MNPTIVVAFGHLAIVQRGRVVLDGDTLLRLFSAGASIGGIAFGWLRTGSEWDWDCEAVSPVPIAAVEAALRWMMVSRRRGGR